MLDIIEVNDGEDLTVFDSTAGKAANVVSTQLGTLEYAPTFGVDMKFFLESPLEFQNESFKAYLIQRLTEHQINVTGVTEVLEALLQRLTFFVGDLSQKGKGLVI